MKMRRSFRQLALLTLLMVIGLTASAQAAFTPFVGAPFITNSASPGDDWYGNKALNLGFGSVGFAGTFPWYNEFDTISTTYKGDSPVLYPLSMVSGYHNATQYGRALAVSNVVRGIILQQAQAKTKKETGDPMLGKSPASLSFWQWIKMGEMALRTYSKVASIVNAISAGDVTINVWKLIPKISVLNEDDPSAPVLVMGLVPASQGAIAMAKQIVNVNDPRYYLGNHVKFDELQNLVPSLAVKPSFYGAYAHMATSDPTSRNVQMVENISRNVHELRTSLSMLNRQMAGRSHTLADIKRSRFSTAMSRQIGDKVIAQSTQVWDGIFQDAKAHSKFYGPEFSANLTALGAAVNGLKAVEAKEINRAVETKVADTWRAKALASEIGNVTVALETDEYQTGVKLVQDMITTYASETGNHGVFDSEKVQLGVAVADASVNKLIADEIRALRQIYGMRIQREATDKLARYIVPAQQEIQMAGYRLARLNRQLANLERGQAAATLFLKPDDIARIATRLDIRP